jgi:hypothetical protein
LDPFLKKNVAKFSHLCCNCLHYEAVGTLIMTDDNNGNLYFSLTTDGGNTIAKTYIMSKGDVEIYGLISGMVRFVLYLIMKVELLYIVCKE